MVNLSLEATALARTLRQCRRRIVLAESCTAGLASAVLARIPGISRWHCGSAVTYRAATKQAWLDVRAETLDIHSAVSEPVAREMAYGVLARTPEADFAAAVTGHLGPAAPPELDGVVYVAVAGRADARIEILGAWRHQLTPPTRHRRQQQAAALVLGHLREQLLASGPPPGPVAGC